MWQVARLVKPAFLAAQATGFCTMDSWASSPLRSLSGGLGPLMAISPNRLTASSESAVSFHAVLIMPDPGAVSSPS